ncbi:MAG: bifunctional adenosylcobinamide kinase/adenosylcobinamide-phosphate guanylyltransferase, partial [Trueperaceae bacterium]
YIERGIICMIYLITGGARSGKSSYAEAVAKHFSDDVLYIATLQPSDDEMQRRIARHRAQRPPQWRTMEVKLELPQTLQTASENIVLMDCLSGFVSNVLLEYEPLGEEDAIEKVLEVITELITLLQTTTKTVIIVTNEVGYGVVPPYPLGRWFRDALGLANGRVAKCADAVALVVVGIPQTLKGTCPDVTF